MPRTMQPALSPIVSLFHRRKLLVGPTTFLPAALDVRLALHPTRYVWALHIDYRAVGEALILLSTLLFAALRLHDAGCDWVAYELYGLLALSTLYILAVHSTPPRPKSHFGFIWMSVPKNYRDSPSDGILTAVTLVPTISAALLLAALEQPPDAPLRPPNWRIEPPRILPGTTALGALVRARTALVSLAALTSATLLLHACAARWLEAWVLRALPRRRPAALHPRPIVRSTPAPPDDTERRSVPRSELRRAYYFVSFTVLVVLFIAALHFAARSAGLGLWGDLSLLDLAACSLFYQLTLYVALRMAHRAFTLGELGLTCFGGTAVFAECLATTIAQIPRRAGAPPSHPPTFRLPTPLITLQSALIGGPFLAGFLLAPLLVLSRHAAQTPFYGGAGLVVLGPIALWSRWCLGGRDPWLWVLRAVFVGGGRRRVALVASRGRGAAGWSSTGPGRTGMRARVRMGLMAAAAAGVGGNGGGGGTPLAPAGVGDALIAASGDFLDRADKRVPTLRLNARRKFFHALVVVMFVPGVAFDPAFTHLAFSAAFALFIFAEYIRYFAIYPFGAAIHLFMAEFLDTKDGGTAILSHFYLLTGCAGSLWLEGPSRLLHFTGVLVLGVGDALASIVGKRRGVRRWSPTTQKTLEGSAALAGSVVASAWALRVCGLVEPFSTPRYVGAMALAAALEALSDQNDNLTLPLYAWSALVLARVS
ncbi:hypothetical protein C8J57DRAFT_1709065 [Mycena rebaudengoi]|nr:hypothetical protein C8J57DRAFT_1709065 [Mycena rebaudengoi]